MSEKVYDVAIIGAGPAGLTSALYCGRADLSTIVFGNIFESQIAKAGQVENYPGIESIPGIDLIEKFDEQVKKYDVNLIPSNITRIKRGELFTLYTDEGEYRSKSVIIATGAKYRELHIPGEKEFVYKGVSYCSICDGTLYKGKKVALVGHGDQAAKSALYLAGLCSEVIALTEKKDLEAPMYEEQMRASKRIKVTGNAKVVAIEGKEFVERIRYVLDKQEERTEEVEGVFIEGGIPNTLLAGELGIDLDAKGNIKVNRPEQTTNIEGVFAAGDVTSGIHQISKAVGEGASAAINAMVYIKKKGIPK
ncbi:thioredoxin-disulfide reductase [Methanocella sp. CWC-04]|uniref:Thioredoxin-disulfide reductase n=1 Tax=Methanooceanicella nereidis TaxID=2052831 RepID=A0AAP2RAU6_9EURY|nr:FAD-dependent oxidoreductase [Methanocella sp. CWC-04]MCD1293958.1 thioredoxin-disulfide reductase [Methanocella sp. CWC-04]